MSLTLPQSAPAADVRTRTFRPPAIPLVTHTPYFSNWFMGNRLHKGWTKHWTGAYQGMSGLVRVDGQPYRFIGTEPKEVPGVEQVEVAVHPTRTVLRFHAGPVELEVEFLSPLLPDDLDLLTRPVTYVTFNVRPLDGESHDVRLYFDVTGEWCVHFPHEQVFFSRPRIEGVEALALRSVEQSVLRRKGDILRIDWGTMFIAAPAQEGLTSAIGANRYLRPEFCRSGQLPWADDMRFPRSAKDLTPVAALCFDLGQVGQEGASRFAMLAYDEEWSVEYLQQRLRPYWRRKGHQADWLLRTAAEEYEDIRPRCEKFDAELERELEAAGGWEYMKLASLAYRQTLAAHCIVETPQGGVLMFSKENYSNGCMGTVDVTYPGAPFFLHFNPELLKAQLVPILEYAETPRWPWPYAPHDLGVFPLANGQAYGGGEYTEHDQMPVEECGNMLLLVASVCRAQGDVSFAVAHWGVLTKWADYLLAAGMDPENQLCTDDFAGYLAHNANLSLKAILALGAYAQMCEMRGEDVRAKMIRETAESMAAQWMRMADEGDHTRLAFNKRGSWSQKYNLVWDRLLGLGLFPEELARKEVAFYRKKIRKYGVPLDSRQSWTKLDWSVWTASLAESREDFEALVHPLYKFADETEDRVPLTDFYDTKDASLEEFQARSVVGGIYLPLVKSLG